MCAWSDNDTFGILVSPTLNAAGLANLMVQDRPLIDPERLRCLSAQPARGRGLLWASD